MSATLPRLILASASPRRLDILRAHGHDPVVIKPDVNEQLDAQTALPDLPALLEELALSKARYVFGCLASKEVPGVTEALSELVTAEVTRDATSTIAEVAGAQTSKIVEAQTAQASGIKTIDVTEATTTTVADGQPLIIIAADTVVYTDHIIGKPRDHAAAVQTLLELRNRTHTVLTAVAVIELPDATELSFTDQALVRFGDYNLETIEHYIATEPPYDKAGSYAIQGIWSRQVTSIEGDQNTVIGLPYQHLADLLGWK